MARYLGPKVKLSRRVGVPIADVPKHTAKRQLTTPGMHGYRGRRLKDYGIRQNEKQKLRYHYSVLERQFRRYIEEASRGKGNTGEALMALLEQRLDNVIRRAGLTRTIWASRQMVVHGHVLVNGKKIDIPSYQVKVGEVITLASRASKNALVAASVEAVKGRGVPRWLELDAANLSGKVLALPARDDVSFPIQEQLIVELYSK